MSAPVAGDAAFKYTLDGQEYWHHLGHPLHRTSSENPETVFGFDSADLTTLRRVAITSTATDLTGFVRRDGQNESLARFLKSARAGATLEYFPSLANPSEAYPCSLIEADAIAPDPDFWWQRRYGTRLRLRRTDGGSWAGVTEGTLFYYKAGNDLPGLTFTRSGAAGTYVDEDGVVQDSAANLFRTTWINGSPYLLLELARTNRVTDDDLTNWSTLGTPVVTGSVSDSAGGTGAYTVEDNDGASAEYIFFQPTIAGDTTASLVFEVRENTMPASGAQVLQLYDSTAGTSRLRLAISGWTNGEPSVTATTGTFLAKREIGNGYWRLYGLATSVDTGNTNQIRIRPADTAAETGSIDVYRVNLFDANTPGVSIVDASETRNVDAFSASIGFTPVKLPFTLYVKFREIGTSYLSSASDNMLVGGDSTAGFQIDAFGGDYRAIMLSGSSTLASKSINPNPSYLDEVEISMQFAPDGALTVEHSVNEGAVTTETEESAAEDVPEDWGAQTITLCDGGPAAWSAIKIQEGAKSLVTMRAL